MKKSVKLKCYAEGTSSVKTGGKEKKKEKEEESDSTRVNNAKDNYASKLGLTKDQVVTSYMKDAYGRGENLLKSTGNKASTLDDRKGSSTKTVSGQDKGSNSELPSMKKLKIRKK